MEKCCSGLGSLRSAGNCRLQIAESLLDKAIDAGYRKPESYLERARARAKAGDEVRASDDALAVLDFDAVPDHVVKQAIRLFGGQAPVDLHEAPAIVSLDPDDQIDLAESLARLGEGVISDAIPAPFDGRRQAHGGGACQRCESTRAELHRVSPVREGDQAARAARGT